MADLNTIKTTVNATIRTETQAGGITPTEVADILDSIINEIRDRGILWVADLTAVNAVNPTDSKHAGDISTGNVYRHNGSTWVLILEPGAGTGGGGPVQLSTPGSFVAADQSSSQINLTWTDVANESSYRLEWSPNGIDTWTQIGGTLAPGTTSYNHTGLTASTQYFYRLKAVGDGVNYIDSAYATANDTTQAGGSFDADAQAYFTAVEGGGYTFGTGEKNAINAFVVGLKADSLWTPCVALYPMIGSAYGSMKWNLKSPLNTDGAYRLEEIGTPLYTANGAKCETGEALNTNFELSGLSVTGNAIGIYIRENANGNYYDMGGNGSASPVVQLIARNSDTAFSDNPNSGGTGRISTANTNSTRLFIQTRQSATSHKLFRDGTQLGTTNTNDVTGESYPTAQLWIGASNNNGSAQEGNKEFCFAFISTSGFSDTDVANMTSRVNTLVTALGRNV